MTEKQSKWQTISMNWFHISKVEILYFLWGGGLHVRGSDAYPVASLILVISPHGAPYFHRLGSDNVNINIPMYCFY